MTRLLIIGAICMTLGATAVSLAQEKAPAERPNASAAQRKGPPPPMIQLIEGIYVNSLRQQGRQVEITDEQINRILPFLRQYVEDRNQIGGARRLRIQKDLQQALNRAASDEELSRLIQQFDRIDADVRAAQEQFLSSTDPILTIRQRAWLRVWQLRVDAIHWQPTSRWETVSHTFNPFADAEINPLRPAVIALGLPET